MQIAPEHQPGAICRREFLDGLNRDQLRKMLRVLIRDRNVELSSKEVQKFSKQFLIDRIIEIEEQAARENRLKHVNLSGNEIKPHKMQRQKKTDAPKKTYPGFTPMDFPARDIAKPPRKGSLMRKLCEMLEVGASGEELVAELNKTGRPKPECVLRSWLFNINRFYGYGICSKNNNGKEVYYLRLPKDITSAFD